ncbi:MAG TPA: response regulator transcription factor [Pseudobacteroides sp.]|uniref:response regulator transcription factor n=1 Tax=Pseudobacteroides sp. TaxID=1968840 RepID=UPI002F9498BB
MNVMLVEDDKALALGMEYALKKEGFNVSIAGTIKEAQRLLDNSTELVLLDVSLPDGSGYDFCMELRAKSNVPVIFITALDSEANVVFGLDIGGDDYITKPVRISEMLSRIKAVMRRRSDQHKNELTNIIVSGNISIEPLKCKVMMDGAEVNLTAAEYKLLLLLVENKERVLERNQIIEKLWDIDGSFIDHNTLNVYVKRLREKIESESKKHIETLRGIGYMWKDEV